MGKERRIMSGAYQRVRIDRHAVHGVLDERIVERRNDRGVGAEVVEGRLDKAALAVDGLEADVVKNRPITGGRECDKILRLGGSRGGHRRGEVKGE